jgi:hypothetical protein
MIGLKLLFLSFFLIVSCENIENNKNDIKIFEATKYIDWFFSHRLKIFNKHYYNSDHVINRPVFTWQILAQFDLIGSGGASGFTDCLFYKIPYLGKKEKKTHGKGQLKVIKLTKNKKCKDVRFDKKGLVVNEVKNLKIFFSHKKLVLKESKKIIPPFTFSINFNKKNKDHWLFFPLGNINHSTVFEENKKNEKNVSFLRERYSSAETKGLHPGLLFWPGLDNNSEKDFRIGRDHLKYPDGNAVKCETWSDHCQRVGPSLCGQCQWGWYEVVGGKCLKFNDRYCGQSYCGQLGWPACFKGKESYKLVSYKGHCRHSKARSFCQDGLEKVCDGDGVVICL